MLTYLSLPFFFLQFWFFEAPKKIVRTFLELNNAAMHALSFQILIVTFFQPLKNEYRKGLVGFSIGMGIVVKLFLLVFASVILLAVLALEILTLVLFLSIPVLTVMFIVRRS